jgi:hypothetical protein
MSVMDADLVSAELKSFFRTRKAPLSALSRQHSKVLEAGAAAYVARHYELKNYSVQPQSRNRGLFHVKPSAGGNFANYSWFECVRGNEQHAVRINVPVVSAFGVDDGVYVVDIAVTPLNPPTATFDGSPPAIANSDLLTFGEVKALRMYPMGLAHFIGIVHELQPRFITGRRRRGFVPSGHFDPTLFALGTLTPNSTRIVSHYRKRGMRLNIIPMFDRYLLDLNDVSKKSVLRP